MHYLVISKVINIHELLDAEVTVDIEGCRQKKHIRDRDCDSEMDIVDALSGMEISNERK